MRRARMRLGLLLGMAAMGGCGGSPIAAGSTPGTALFLVPASGARVAVRDYRGATGFVYTCTERISGTVDFPSSAGGRALINFRFLAANGAPPVSLDRVVWAFHLCW